jgi:ABC transporter substrate binding protein
MKAAPSFYKSASLPSLPKIFPFDWPGRLQMQALDSYTAAFRPLGTGMKRREFIGLVGGMAAALPFAARAQQSGKIPTIGFLGVNTSVWGPWTAAFVERLRGLGWIEGHTINIEYRWSEGRPEKYPDFAAEFARLKVDVIVTSAAAVLAATRAAPAIPVVFTLALDPVGVGLVNSLARPGGNVTGNSAWRLILRANALNCCARPSPACAGWRSWRMPACLNPCSR